MGSRPTKDLLQKEKEKKEENKTKRKKEKEEEKRKKVVRVLSFVITLSPSPLSSFPKLLGRFVPNR